MVMTVMMMVVMPRAGIGHRRSKRNCGNRNGDDGKKCRTHVGILLLSVVDRDPIPFCDNARFLAQRT